MSSTVIALVVVGLVVLYLLLSFSYIGPTEVAFVAKQIGGACAKVT
jgi:hypothetical protein